MKRRTPLKRSGKLERKAELHRKRQIKRRNARRRAKEFTRAYGSVERVRRVQAMPCCVCGGLPSENAHIPGGSGAGRKGDARWIIPLCKHHHEEMDDVLGPGPFARKHGVDLPAIAARTAEEVGG